MKKRLLAIAMTLAMTLSLLPVMAGAAGDANVAEVNGTGYPTLQDAFDNAQDGDTVKLLTDVTLDPLYAMDEEMVKDAPIRNVITVTSDITLNLASHKISWDSTRIPGENESEIWYTLCFFTVSGADVKITGNGTIDVEAGNNNSYGINITNNGSVTVEDGTYTGATTAIQVQEGSLTILGGTFKQAETIAGLAPGYAKYVINCIDANFKDGTARIYVKGGTFCFDPDGKPENSDVTYVPVDYESKANEDGTWTVTAKESINVDKPSSGNISNGTVDATVSGVTVPADSSGQVVMDAAVENASDVTTANVTVGGDALTAVKEAINVSSLAIKTNVGTLTISDAALDTIITNATDGSSVADVTLSIKVSEFEENSVTYDFTATDARGEEVFDQTASEDATITVTVDAPSGASADDIVYIYYIDGDTRTLEDTPTVAEDKTVTWDVTHFSSREITKTMDEVTYTNSEGTEVTGTLAEAVENAKENTTITLNRDVTATDKAIAIENKSFKLDLNGHNIVKETGTSAIFSVKGGILRVTGSGTIESKMGDAFSVTGNTTALNTNKTEAVLVIEKGVRVKALWNCVWIAGNGAQADIYGSLTSTGVYAVIQGNGTKNSTTDYSGTIVNIYEGASVIHAGSDESAHMAIYQPQNGVLNIYGGTISAIQEGSTAIEIRAGELNISGDAVITGGEGIPESAPNGSGGTTNNAAVAIAQHTTNQPIQVNITGGTLIGGAAVYESNPQNNQEGPGNSVSVTIKDAKLTGALNSSGFGTVTVDNTTITGNVGKTGTGNMGITGSTITGKVTKGATNSGYLGFVNSIINGTAPEVDAPGVTYVNTKVNDKTVNTTVDTGKEAMINGVQYNTLEEAIKAAKDGDVVILLNNVTLDGNGKGNNEGLVTIKKDITLDGNGKTITAEKVGVGEATAAGPSMINIQDGANVTVRNLTIDGAGVASGGSTSDATKHGLNIYGDTTTVTVENVQIRNGNGYAIVANGADVTVDGLITEKNGWGGINVDSKSGAASLTIEDADIGESNSVKIENTSVAPKPADPTVKIQAGSFKDIVLGSSINAETYEKSGKMVISGGTFAGGSEVDAVDIADYLKDGLAIDGNGNVYTPSQGGSSGGSTRYTVTAPTNVANGSVKVSPTRASRGQTVTITVTPDEGYELASLAVYDADGDAVSLTDAGNGKYTFTMPRSKVTVEAAFAEAEHVCPAGDFADVSQSAWYHAAVDYVLEQGIMSGVSADRFGPEDTLTRAMAAQMLWALEGKPVVNYLMQYGDVAQGAWYAEAVRWASAQGVMSGYSGETFGPEDNITREQLALILFNYADQAGYDVDGRADLSGYADEAAVSGWAVTALEWAVDAGLISGREGSALAPAATATRAEVAQIFMNFLENVAK